MILEPTTIIKNFQRIKQIEICSKKKKIGRNLKKNEMIINMLNLFDYF